MNIEEFIESLNFMENDYFYHITGKGNALDMFDEGLYVDGNNILDTDNILETTTLPLTEDMILTSSDFMDYLKDELNDLGVRDKSEFVVLGAPKDMMRQLVSRFDDYKDGKYYEGVIPSEHIMGYFEKETLEFIPNENFNYGTDEYYDTISYK